MSITIKRNTGWIGGATDIQIKLNGEKVAKVMENQTVEVEFSGDKAYIKAAQFGTKSNEIQVKDGDMIEIKATRWYRMSIPIIIPIIVLINYIPDSYKTAARISLLVLFLISIIFMDAFHIKVIERE